MLQLSVHPFIQLAATLLSIYVLFLGLNRFRSLHLHQRTTFKYKRHVYWGTIVMAAWLAGLIGGLVMVRLSWHGNFMTGYHARIGVAMAPFILFGWFSGFYMNRNKKKRTILPFLHGLNNLTAVILALIQFWMGWRVFTVFVLGD